MDILAELKKLRIVPVVKLDKAEHALPLATALKAGGLPCMEITFRTAAAPDAIRAAAGVPDMVLGAGTVLTVDQAKKAEDCGARFIVSPGFSAKVVEHCLARNLAVIPGVCTPTEVQMALEYGLKVLKFFPAENYGGIKTLKAIGAAYGDVKFVPTGGIELLNLVEYLKLPNVLACGGTWMVKADLVAGGKFDEITHLARQAVTLAATA